MIRQIFTTFIIIIYHRGKSGWNMSSSKYIFLVKVIFWVLERDCYGGWRSRPDVERHSLVCTLLWWGARNHKNLAHTYYVHNSLLCSLSFSLYVCVCVEICLVLFALCQRVCLSGSNYAELLKRAACTPARALNLCLLWNLQMCLRRTQHACTYEWASIPYQPSALSVFLGKRRKEAEHTNVFC